MSSPENSAQAAREQGIHRAHLETPLPPSMTEIMLRNLQAKDGEIKNGRDLRAAAKCARKAAAGILPRPFLPGWS